MWTQLLRHFVFRQTKKGQKVYVPTFKMRKNCFDATSFLRYWIIWTLRLMIKIHTYVCVFDNNSHILFEHEHTCKSFSFGNLYEVWFMRVLELAKFWLSVIYGDFDTQIHTLHCCTGFLPARLTGTISRICRFAPNANSTDATASKMRCKLCESFTYV